MFLNSIYFPELMIIGVVGPTRIKEFCIALRVEESSYMVFLEKIAEYLASTNHELLIMPAHDTSPGVIASIYKDLNGRKVIGLVPEDDVEFGLNDIDGTIADETINCGTWRNQPEAFCEKADILLVVGLSPGAMLEMCYAKWFKVKHIYVMEDFLSSRLPPELEKDIPIKYITIHDLEEYIR